MLWAGDASSTPGVPAGLLARQRAAVLGTALARRSLAGLLCGLAIVATARPPLPPFTTSALLGLVTMFLGVYRAAEDLVCGATLDRRQVLSWAATLLATGAAVLASTPHHAHYALMLGLVLLAGAGNTRSPRPSQAVRGGMLLAAAIGVTASLSRLAVDSFSLAHASRVTVGQNSLGPSYLGAVPLLASVACIACLGRGSAPWRLAVAGLQVAAGAGTAWLLAPEHAWLAPYAAVSVGGFACRLDSGAAGAPSRGRAWAWGAAAWGVAFSLVATPAAWLVTLRPGKVVFYNRGGLDWEVPSFERTGAWEGGMFGLLPRYLAAGGFTVSLADTHQAWEAALETADVGVVINCDEVWTDRQRETLRALLRRGKRILVLGDHTDVFGLMKGHNSFLEDYGISFVFDSAYHAVDSWPNCAEALPGSLYEPSRFPLTHGVGASLTVRPPARALVVGRHAFSDTGIRENTMGSYLGNYSLDAGEGYGDQVLIATAMDSGIVVYGDTTAFQNGALSESWTRHVRPLFLRLCGRAPLDGGAAVVVLALLGLVIGGIAGPGGLAPALAGIALGWMITAPTSLGATIDAHRRHALVDVRDAGGIGHYEARRNPVGPLLVAMERAGFLPVLARKGDRDPGGAVGIRVILCPQVTPSRAAVEAAEREVQAGGTVLVVGGGDSTAEAYVRTAGLRLGPHLGECPPRRARDDDPLLPRFRNAWSIDVDPGLQAEALFRVAGFVPAIRVKRGAGWLLWIADSQFFSGPNVEGMWGQHKGNMQFVREVLSTIPGPNAASAEPPWPSPPKPQ